MVSLDPTRRVSSQSWRHNLIVLGHSKRPDEREFYLRMAVQEHWSKRELERQFRLAAFERAVLHPRRLSPARSVDCYVPEKARAKPASKSAWVHGKTLTSGERFGSSR